MHKMITPFRVMFLILVIILAWGVYQYIDNRQTKRILNEIQTEQLKNDINIIGDSIHVLEQTQSITLGQIEDRRVQLDKLEHELRKRNLDTITLEEAIRIIRGN